MNFAKSQRTCLENICSRHDSTPKPSEMSMKFHAHCSWAEGIYTSQLIAK